MFTCINSVTVFSDTCIVPLHVSIVYLIVVKYILGLYYFWNVSIIYLKADILLKLDI